MKPETPASLTEIYTGMPSEEKETILQRAIDTVDNAVLQVMQPKDFGVLRNNAAEAAVVFARIAAVSSTRTKTGLAVDIENLNTISHAAEQVMLAFGLGVDTEQGTTTASPGRKNHLDAAKTMIESLKQKEDLTDDYKGILRKLLVAIALQYSRVNPRLRLGEERIGNLRRARVLPPIESEQPN